MRKGRAFTGDLAKTFYQDFGISAKNLDHIHNGLQGRIDSVRECAVDNVKTLTGKIAAKKRNITWRLSARTKACSALSKERRKASPDEGLIAKMICDRDVAASALHQHRRRLARLEHHLLQAEKRVANPTLCFGSRELLRARSLIDNDDVESVRAWRDEWDRRCHLEVFVPGTARAP